MDTKGSAGHINGSDHVFTGEDCIAACNGMWKSVLTAKPEKDSQRSKVNLQGVYELPILFDRGNGSYPFSAQISQGEYRVFGLGRSLLRICDCRSEFVAKGADDRRKLQRMCFRRFEASEAIRHDREPAFMSEFFVRSTELWDRM